MVVVLPVGNACGTSAFFPNVHLVLAACFLIFCCTFKEEPNSTVALAAARFSVVGCDCKMDI